MYVLIKSLNALKVFEFLIFCGSSFHSLVPTYLIELLHTCNRLHHYIGSFPWVSHLKFLLVRLMSSKSITNHGAKPLTHWLWQELRIEYVLNSDPSSYSWVDKARMPDAHKNAHDASMHARHDWYNSILVTFFCLTAKSADARSLINAHVFCTTWETNKWVYKTYTEAWRSLQQFLHWNLFSS